MKPVEWIRRRIREAGAPSEADTDRDGVFSYAAETHAFTVGVHDGIRYLPPFPRDPPDHPDAAAEPHYYKGGYVAGTVVQFAFVITVVALVGTL